MVILRKNPNRVGPKFRIQAIATTKFPVILVVSCLILVINALVPLSGIVIAAEGSGYIFTDRLVETNGNMSASPAELDMAHADMMKPKTKSRMRMTLYSAALPGLGQYYGGRRITGVAFLVASLGTVAGSVLGYMEYNKAVDEYNDSVKHYKNALAPPDIESTKSAMRDAYDNADWKYTIRQISFAALGGMWAMNVIHALVVGPSETITYQTKIENSDWGVVTLVKPNYASLALFHKF